MNLRSPVSIPLLPAAGLSAATGGAVVLGAAGALGAGPGPASGLTCVFAAVTGIACPFCGLTHGVAALGAGDVAAALEANPLAPLAAGLALAVPLALVRARTGGRSLAVPAATLWGLAAIVLTAWLVRLA